MKKLNPKEESEPENSCLVRQDKNNAKKEKENSMAKKSIVLRGLTALLTFVFSLSIVTGVTLEAYKSTIDTNLGTQSEKFVSEST